jgi:hypothetical protein
MRAAPVIMMSFALAAACSGSSVDHGASKEAPRGSTAGPEQSDAALTQYLAWQHDFRTQVKRHRIEQEATAQRVAGKYPAFSTGLSTDPELLAVLTRQRRDMQFLMDRMPKGPTMEALGATIEGLGTTTAGPEGIALIYTPRRDEAVLDSARAKYGDGFVRWVIQHEGTITAALTAVQ